MGQSKTYDSQVPERYHKLATNPDIKKQGYFSDGSVFLRYLDPDTKIAEERVLVPSHLARIHLTTGELVLLNGFVLTAREKRYG